MPPYRATTLAPLLALALLASGATAGTALAQTTSASSSTTSDTQSVSWQAAWDSGSQSVLRSWFEANTGPKVALTRSSTGVYTVGSQAAADALVGRTVYGRVAVTASGVRLHDFKVVNDGSASTSIHIGNSLTGVVLEDFEVDGRNHLKTTAAVGGASWSNVTVRRAHIHHSLDGVRLFEGSTYEHVYVEDATANPDYVSGTSSQHADAVQAVRAGAGKPITVRQSWFDHSAVGPNVTSVAMLKSDAGSLEDLTMESNYINGGRYTVTIEAGAHGAPRNIAVRNNRFGRNYQHGLWSGAGVNNGAGYDRSGNVWADTLQPATLTWGKLPIAGEPVTTVEPAPTTTTAPTTSTTTEPAPTTTTAPAPTTTTAPAPAPTTSTSTPTVKVSVPRAATTSTGVTLTADLSVDRSTTFAKLPRIAVRDSAGRSTDAQGGLDTGFGASTVNGSVVLSGTRALAAGTYTAFVAYSLDGSTWVHGQPTTFTVKGGLVDTGTGVRVSAPRASAFTGGAALVADVQTARSLKFAKLARIAIRDSAGRSRDARGGLDIAFGPKTINGDVLLKGSRSLARGSYTAFVTFSLDGSTWVRGPVTTFHVA